MSNLNCITDWETRLHVQYILPMISQSNRYVSCLYTTAVDNMIKLADVIESKVSLMDDQDNRRKPDQHCCKCIDDWEKRKIESVDNCQWLHKITGKLIAAHHNNWTKDQHCCKCISYIETRKVACIDIIPNNVTG